MTTGLMIHYIEVLAPQKSTTPTLDASVRTELSLSRYPAKAE